MSNCNIDHSDASRWIRLNILLPLFEVAPYSLLLLLATTYSAFYFFESLCNCVSKGAIQTTDYYISITSNYFYLLTVSQSVAHLLAPTFQLLSRIVLNNRFPTLLISYKPVN